MPRAGVTSALSAGGPAHDAIPRSAPDRNTASTRLLRSSARASSSPTRRGCSRRARIPTPCTAPHPRTRRPLRPSPASPAIRRGRFADRVATIALLVYGLVHVVTSIPSMIDYEAYVTTVLGLLGVDARARRPGGGSPVGDRRRARARDRLAPHGLHLVAQPRARAGHLVDPARRRHRVHCSSAAFCSWCRSCRTRRCGTRSSTACADPLVLGSARAQTTATPPAKSGVSLSSDCSSPCLDISSGSALV